MVTLAFTAGMVTSFAAALLSLLCGMVLGLIVYVWRTKTGDLREGIDKAGQNIQRLDSVKAEQSNLEKIIQEIREESREAQARYVFLNETLSNALNDIRREYARTADCQVKHATLHDGVQMLGRQFGEFKTTLHEMSKKLDLLIEWKAFKSGEEKGRVDR
jgi:hypothetical protein